MPNVGPNFFNLSAAPINNPPNNWTNPGNASGAPNGNYASVPCQINIASYYLWFTQWLGIQYLPPTVNLNSVLIELYGYVDPTAASAGLNFQSAFVLNNNFVPGATTGTIAFTTSPSWQSLVRVSGSSFAYNGSVNSTWGVAIEFYYTSGSFGSAPLYIDSARMTVSYNDGFFDPVYGFSKNKRRYITKRNFQEKMVFEQTKIRMQKKKVA